jgi:Na+/H+ antiporter NhaD/arsenite permease-like protein
MMNLENLVKTLLADFVILLSLFGIALGRIPTLRMNRATIAFSGAAFLVAIGALSIQDALGAIDLNTLILILSMMIITANLKISGFFDLAGTAVLRASRTPRRLLVLIMGASAILSALFLNDTVCIMFTPLVAVLTLRSKRNPVPYLIALALSANIGSAATIIGNPQNMLIGASSGIPFLIFLKRMAIPSILGLFLAYGAILWGFRREFSRGGIIEVPPLSSPRFVQAEEFNGPGEMKNRVYKPLLLKALAAVVLMTAAFLLNAPVTAAAMVAAAILLTTRRIKPERVFAELDWTIIAFFGGLFVITEAVGRTSAFSFLVQRGMPLVGQGMGRFSFFILILSNLISNVPAVMLLRPLIEWFKDRETAWLVLAMASTYAGNLTLLGSVANLIVAESAKRYGIDIKFGAYLKVGLPTTILTVVLGTLWLSFF